MAQPTTENILLYVQVIGALISGVVAIVAIAALVWERRSKYHDQQTEVFLRLLDTYDQVNLKRQQNWQTIKKYYEYKPEWVVRYAELSSGLEYLIAAPVFSSELIRVELEQVRLEIGSLNILNQLCSLAERGELRTTLLGLLMSDEVLVYQARAKDIDLIYEAQKLYTSLPKPRTTAILRIKRQDLGREH